MYVYATQPMETMVQVPELQLQKPVTSFEFPDLEAPGAWVIDHTTGHASYTGKVVESIKVDGEITQVTITRRTIEYPVPMLEVAYEWALKLSEDIGRGSGLSEGSSTQMMETEIRVPEVKVQKSVTSFKLLDMEVSGAWVVDRTTSKASYTGKVVETTQVDGQNMQVTITRRTIEFPVPMSRVAKAYMEVASSRESHSSEISQRTTSFATPRVGLRFRSGTGKRVSEEWLDKASSSRMRLGSLFVSLELGDSSNDTDLYSPIRDPNPPLRDHPLPHTITLRTIEYPVSMSRVLKAYTEVAASEESSEIPRRTTLFATPGVGLRFRSGTGNLVSEGWLDKPSSSRMRLGSPSPSLVLEDSPDDTLYSPIRDPDYSLYSPIRHPYPPLREDEIEDVAILEPPAIPVIDLNNDKEETIAPMDIKDDIVVKEEKDLS